MLNAWKYRLAPVACHWFGFQINLAHKDSRGTQYESRAIGRVRASTKPNLETMRVKAKRL